MGVFFAKKCFFLLFAPFFLPFGLLFLSFRVLSASSCFAFSFCFVSFSAVSLSFLLFVYLLAFALALLRASFLLLFLLLISYFSLFPFSFLFISFVYDCPLFCLRCGRELRSIGKLRCRAGIDAVCKKNGAERVIPFLCPLRIFHQPGILLPVPRALGYHIYCQSSSLYFSQRLLQCHVPGSL